MNESQALRLQAKLPQIDGYDRDCNPAKVTVRSFIRAESYDGKILHTVMVSAEEGDGAADYYGHKYYPTIAPALEAFAKKQGGHWEWVNPGCIAFYK